MSKFYEKDNHMSRLCTGYWQGCNALVMSVASSL